MRGLLGHPVQIGERGEPQAVQIGQVPDHLGVDQLIDQFVAQTTIVTLRIQLGPEPKAIIYDSENMCQYECELKEKKAYRMGVYGCGWAMDIIELS